MIVVRAVVTVIALAALVSAIIRARRPRSFPLATLMRAWFARRPSPTLLVLAAGTGLASVAIGLAVGLAFGWSRIVVLEPPSMSWLALAAAGVGVKVAYVLFEELIFRGALVSELRRWAGRGSAVGVSALVFALAHSGRSAIDLAILFADGVGFALAVVATGSLWVAVVWHAAKNVSVWALHGRGTIDLVAGPVAVLGGGPSWLIGSPTGAGLIDLVSTVLLVGSFSWYLLRRPPS